MAGAILQLYNCIRINSSRSTCLSGVDLQWGVQKSIECEISTARVAIKHNTQTFAYEFGCVQFVQLLHFDTLVVTSV